jgi:tRNA G10  N-methylase Trm11
MQLYAFILGRKHLLSIAELCRALPKTAKILDISVDALVAAFEEPLEKPQEALDRLGGTIKIAEIFNEDIASTAQIADATGSFLVGKFANTETKFPYALSLYSFSQKPDHILRKSLNSIKRILVSAGLKSRFINKNFQNPESAAINGEKLLTKGAEIVAIKGSRKIFLGHTVALQDFEDYGRRDFSRPERDPRLGMLPPKLCQIMINLCAIQTFDVPGSSKGKQSPSKVVYDPFCGIGTVLAEALLMGYNAVGSDIEADIIAKCGKNMDWLKKTYSGITGSARLFAHDATRISNDDLPERIDLVVTESYLGPPVSRMPLPENMRKTFANITNLVSDFFRALHPLIQKDTPVAICLPFYRDNHKFHFIPGIVEKITDNGFTAEEPIPAEITEKFAVRGTTRLSLIYDRPDQTVGREIFIFRKN